MFSLMNLERSIKMEQETAESVAPKKVKELNNLES
jgi:hypothetical protein